jgi:hypothetical protein
MTKRFRRNHSPAFKAKVALAVMLSESRTVRPRRGSFPGSGFLDQAVWPHGSS